MKKDVTVNCCGIDLAMVIYNKGVRKPIVYDLQSIPDPHKNLRDAVNNFKQAILKEFIEPYLLPIIEKLNKFLNKFIKQ